MDVTATLELSDDEFQELSDIVGGTRTQLSGRLRKYATAAMLEYVTMILGQRVFRRASDIHEFRLFLLIEHVFDNEIPDEQAVCRLFQLTPTESRSLIRSVMAKYQYQLKTAIDKSMKSAVSGATAATSGDPFIATIKSRNVVDALNVILAELDGSLQTVSKKQGSVAEYEISPASYKALCQELRVSP